MYFRHAVAHGLAGGLNVVLIRVPFCDSQLFSSASFVSSNSPGMLTVQQIGEFEPISGHHQAMILYESLYLYIYDQHWGPGPGGGVRDRRSLEG